MPEPQIAKCRSCGDPIIWVRTTNQKLMPINAVPVTNGNIVLHPDNGLAYYKRTSLYEPLPFDAEGLPTYTSHFSSCPNAAAHRKKK